MLIIFDDLVTSQWCLKKVSSISVIIFKKSFPQKGYYLDMPLKVLTTLTVVTVVVC